MTKIVSVFTDRRHPPPPPLCRLLTAVLRVLEKYPNNEDMVFQACHALPLCRPHLPEQPPPIMANIHNNALSCFANFESSTRVFNATYNLLRVLWVSYPQSISSSCNMGQLAGFLNIALDTGSHGDRQAVIRAGRDLVGCFMRVLGDRELEALEGAGVYGKLRSLISFYDDMAPEDLLQIIVGVGMFAELKPNPQAFLEENIHTSLLFAAQKFGSHLPIQQLTWQLLSLNCRKSPDFVRRLLEEDVLSAVVEVLKQEGSHPAPVVHFLTICCHTVPKPSIQLCLEHRDLMECLLGVVCVDGAEESSQNVTNTCDFLSFLCSKCGSDGLRQVMDLRVIPKLEQAARKWPVACILPACIALEGVVNLFPPDLSALPAFIQLRGSIPERVLQLKAEFYAQDHHLFIKEMMSNPDVYTNVALLELMYVTFQKLLRQSTQEATAKMFSREFIEFFVISFVRDTITFPNEANRICFTAHFFVFQMKAKEPIEFLRELEFHTAVANYLQSTDSYDITVSCMGLLACLTGKYYDLLKDVRPILMTQAPAALVSKAKQYGTVKRSHFADDFGRILLNMTADKELSLELYDKGYMLEMLELVDTKYTSVVKRCAIHAVGNIALAGQHIKQILLDRKLYETLLHILSHDMDSGDPYLLSACCRVLHILASGDWAKRKFVESGCIDILLRMLRTRQDNAEVCWRPLGLLSSLGFMSIMNRRYILTREIVEAVVGILKESSHGKVVSYTMLVFLASGELDEGSTQLRELGVETALTRALQSPQFKKESSDLARWGGHVLEKLHLHTISVPRGALPPPPHACMLVSDWPPHTPEHESMMEVEGSASSPPAPASKKLLPQNDAALRAYFPVAPELSLSAKEQLEKLGLNLDEPLFRIGRVYGSTHGHCSNCDKDGSSEELVIRAQSLTPTQYQLLIDRGWYRRGGVKMFRLRYNHNVCCCDWETKVSVKQFDHRCHKSYKKVLKRMPKGVTVETLPTHFNREAFDLYNEYHIQKHDKPRKSEYSYCEHIVNSPLAQQTVGGVEYGTFHQLYRLDGKLVAIGIIDVVPRGIVSIYMWYNVSKDISKYSFGVYSALKEIEFVGELSQRNPEMQYYYLQGWNGSNKKLSYKANYEPEAFYCPCITDGWVAGLSEVDASRTAYIQRTREAAESKDGERGAAGTEPRPAEEEKMDEETREAAGSGSGKKSVEIPDGPGSAPPQAAGSGKENCTADPVAGEKESNKPSEPFVPCEAYPNDLAWYQQANGGATPNVGRIVVCLNYSEYMRLEDMYQRFPVGPEQREVIERRLSELLAAIGPELTSQLVIDIKGCVSKHPPSHEPDSNRKPDRVS